MRDEQQLQQLRPSLALDSENATLEEQFQNHTLRPLLKLQHTLLVQWFYGEIARRKKVYFTLTPAAKLDWITQTVRKDLRVRHVLSGMIMGLFTQNELHYFLANEAECTRRLVSLLVQRLQSVSFKEMDV